MNIETKFSIENNTIIYKGKYIQKELKKLSTENFEVLPFKNEKGDIIKTTCLKDNKGIWWFYEFAKSFKLKFLTHDVAHFQFINEDFAKDSSHVFLIAKNGFAIPNSDPETFTILEDTPYFSKDKNQLYGLSSYSGLKIFKNADCKNINSINWGDEVTDLHNIYSCGGNTIKIYNKAKYNSVLDNHATYNDYDKNDIFGFNKQYLFKKYPNLKGWWHPDYEYTLDISSERKNQFYKTKNAVFYIEDIYPILINDADVTTFNTLGNGYGKDADFIYFKHKKLADVDDKSFTVLIEGLAKDNFNYYYNGFKVDCDYESFTFKKDKNLVLAAKDKNYVFSITHTLLGKLGLRTEEGYFLRPIPKSSPSTFKILSKAWSKDSNLVYLYGKPLNKADANTFQFLFKKGFNEWAKDKNYLFRTNGKTVIKGINGANFKVLNSIWGKDDNAVFNFISEHISPSIDVTTFKITDNKGNAEDKNYSYKIVNETIVKSKK